MTRWSSVITFGETYAVEWTRKILAEALHSDGAVDDACRAALHTGATFLPPSEQTVSTANLVPIYERRSRHVAERGIAALGFAEAVDRLRSAGGDVRISQVHSDDWNFVLFLDPLEPVVVACLAVDAAVANRDWDHSTWKA